MFTRRDGLKLTLALAATAVAARPGLFSPVRAAAEPVFKVPPLGYGYDALEPYIDTLTMTIHHDRHHGAYVAALNGLVEKFEQEQVAYPLAEVLLLLTCGTIASCDDFDDFVPWSEHHLDFLRKFAPYHHGVPCERWPLGRRDHALVARHRVQGRPVALP
jgi:hypothetical protein